MWISCCVYICHSTDIIITIIALLNLFVWVYFRIVVALLPMVWALFTVFVYSWIAFYFSFKEKKICSVGAVTILWQSSMLTWLNIWFWTIEWHRCRHHYQNSVVWKWCQIQKYFEINTFCSFALKGVKTQSHHNRIIDNSLFIINVYQNVYIIFCVPLF